jgi:hypothetical protein
MSALRVVRGSVTALVVAAVLAGACKSARWLVRRLANVYDGLDGGIGFSIAGGRVYACPIPMRRSPAPPPPPQNSPDAGLVSFSSNIIAAARALESERPDAYIKDELAASLAGPRALARLRVGGPNTLHHRPALPAPAVCSRGPRCGCAADAHRSTAAGAAAGGGGGSRRRRAGGAGRRRPARCPEAHPPPNHAHPVH